MFIELFQVYGLLNFEEKELDFQINILYFMYQTAIRFYNVLSDRVCIQYKKITFLFSRNNKHLFPHEFTF